MGSTPGYLDGTATTSAVGLSEQARELAAKLPPLLSGVERALMGKPEVVRLALVGLLARGHLLIEDVPGVGKTTLARALARSMDASFRRVQFTSDLLPSDILGVSVYDPSRREFEFQFRHDDAVQAPTEFYVPDSHYPEGYEVQVSDGEYTVDREGQRLVYHHSEHLSVHSLRLRPAKGRPRRRRRG